MKKQFTRPGSRLLLSIPIMAVVALMACERSETLAPVDTARRAGTTLVITPQTDTIAEVGGKTQLQVSTQSPAKVKWQSLDTNATVNASGLVTGIAPGRARIEASAGALADTATVWIAPAPADAVPAAVVVSPAVDTISALGSTVELDALVVDTAQRPLEDHSVSWSTPHPEIVQVSAKGVVKGIARGLALVVATAGSASDTARVWVAPAAPVAVRVTPSADTIAGIGESLQLKGEVLDESGTVLADLSVTWQSLDPQVASVDESGRITARDAGRARIRASYEALADTATISVADASTPTPGVYKIPSSIDATGKEDVSDALAAFIDGVPDNSTIVFPAGATYRVEGIVRFIDRYNLTIEGNGATILALTDGSGVPAPDGERWNIWPRTRSHVKIEGGSDIVIRELKIQGPNKGFQYTPDLEGQHGFRLYGAQNVELDRVEVRDVWGDFVAFQPRVLDSSLAWVRNAHVHDSYFDGNGRQGFAFTASEDILIERNTILNVRRTMFDFEPSVQEGGNRRVTIQDNTGGTAVNHWVALHGLKGAQESIHILRNTIDMPLVVSSAAEGHRRNDIRIQDNVSTVVATGPQRLMQITRADGLVVSGNVQPMDRLNMIGVTVAESCGVKVGGNKFTGTFQQESEVIAYECR